MAEQRLTNRLSRKVVYQPVTQSILLPIVKNEETYWRIDRKLDHGRRIRSLYKHLRILLTVLTDDNYRKINYRPVTFTYYLSRMAPIYKHTFLYKECCNMEKKILDTLQTSQTSYKKYNMIKVLLMLAALCIVQYMLTR